MATITLHDNPIHTAGELPKVGSKAPDFTLTDSDLNDVGLSRWTGKKKLLSVFPSIDTPVCAKSVVEFDRLVAEHDDVAALMISYDLPFDIFDQSWTWFKSGLDF